MFRYGPDLWSMFGLTHHEDSVWALDTELFAGLCDQIDEDRRRRQQEAREREANGG